MDMFFKTKKSIIKMKDKIEIEGKDNSYLTTSSLNGEEKCVLAHYSCKEQALEILDKRKDNYHNLKSVFQKINLYDEIYIYKTKDDD